MSGRWGAENCYYVLREVQYYILNRYASTWIWYLLRKKEAIRGKIYCRELKILLKLNNYQGLCEATALTVSWNVQGSRFDEIIGTKRVPIEQNKLSPAECETLEMINYEWDPENLYWEPYQVSRISLEQLLDRYESPYKMIKLLINQKIAITDKYWTHSRNAAVYKSTFGSM